MQVEMRSAHSAPLISLSPYDDTLFYSSAEDGTVRLWDTRVLSSVKLFKNIKGMPSNVVNDHANSIWVAGNATLFQFDYRKEEIFINQHTRQSKPHSDDISTLAYHNHTIAAANDQGDILLYNNSTEQLTPIASFAQYHGNIINSVAAIQREQQTIWMSGGYDCRLLCWNQQKEKQHNKIQQNANKQEQGEGEVKCNVEESYEINKEEKVGQGECKLVKELDMNKLYSKLNIPCSSNYPFIHHIYTIQATILLSMQSGHVLALPFNQPKPKPKFILQTSQMHVIQSQIIHNPHFHKEILIALNAEGNFALYDYGKRQGGLPIFIEKYKCVEKPVWMEAIGKYIIVAGGSNPQMHFHSFK